MVKLAELKNISLLVHSPTINAVIPSCFLHLLYNKNYVLSSQITPIIRNWLVCTASRPTNQV